MSAAPVPRLRPSLKRTSPSLTAERELWEAGAAHVGGVDEVGRGAWAGPITVGVAVIPQDRRVYKVRDSKMMSEIEREALFDRIADWCEAWAVGHASPAECDDLGMSAAHRLAATRALDAVEVRPDRVLVDGRWDFVDGVPTTMVVKGDARCLSIAAASILAKVTRDRMMREESHHFPHYGFDSNKGYPDPKHQAALQAYGPSTIHRRSWVFMDGLMWEGVARSGRHGQERLF